MGRFQNFQEIIKKAVQVDTEYANDIGDALKSCGVYIESVTAMESALGILKYTLEPDAYRERVESHDKSRRMAHNALIANVNMANRICENIGDEPIYKGNPQERSEYGDFAKEVVDDFYANRDKNKTKYSLNEHIDELVNEVKRPKSPRDFVEINKQNIK